MEYTETGPVHQRPAPPALQSDWWNTIPAFLNWSHDGAHLQSSPDRWSDTSCGSGRSALHAHTPPRSLGSVRLGE